MLLHFSLPITTNSTANSFLLLSPHSIMALLSSLKLLGLAHIFLGPSVLAQNLGKTSLWGAGISPLIDESLWQNLAPTPSTVQQWPAGSIPQRCADAANFETPKLNPADFEVFSVRYADCGTPWGPWSFCRVSQRRFTSNDTDGLLTGI